MKVMNKRKIVLYSLIVISLLGIFLSGYLTYTHYNPPTDGSVCVIGEEDSCSLVTTSVYSKIFGIPVALLGIAWFVMLGFLTITLFTNKKYAREIFSWTILGVVFVAYFIFAEIQLKTICIICTYVHILTIISFVLSYILWKK
ncbi:hypothetical protein COV17_01615 [Candidatus Woesearchaeota archaeon CG10_big_fil_rev_8_21_14_0_10_36_11]|nr:MAG: hypothetical protein COV17_01615 [Candidatus Woesearchaeota archaeon CG10_big_fil_rev_8_21_14_0_10_36_11]